MRFGRRALLRCGAALGAAASLSGCGRLDGSTPGEGTGTAAPAGDGLSVTWRSGPDMPRRRTQTTAVALDGKLYVIGGIVGEGERAVGVYDPDRESWSDAAAPPKPVNHTSATVHGGLIHVFGGYSGSFLGVPPLSAHWVYDPGEDRWRDAPPLPTPRGAMVAATVGDRLYAIGGAAEGETTGAVEVYDAAAGEWETAPPMPTAREHLSAGVIDGNIYVAGGRQGLTPMVGAAERYDPGAREWTKLSPMPTARAGIAGDAAAGRLFVFGGEEVSEQVFEEVEAYHPASGTWEAVAPLPTPRWGLGAAAIGDEVYTVGGGAVPSARETATLEIMSVGE